MADQRIVPNLWFDDQAEEAVEFYTSLFADSRIGRTTQYGRAGREIHGRPEGSVQTIEFELMGQRFVALNGGPTFHPNPSISFFVTLETDEQVDALWAGLSEGGAVAMPLQAYEWSEKYGWVSDRYGVSWQISKGRVEDVGQPIATSLLFVQERHGQAEEAVRFYTSIFEDAKIDGILHAPSAGDDPPTVMHAQFSLAGSTFMAMDGGDIHDFDFNEAVSLQVLCETQEEVDRFWKALGEGGDPAAQQCGWLKDRFGVSWQIVPEELIRLMSGPDAERRERTMAALLEMKKLDAEALRRAADGVEPPLPPAQG